MTLQRHNRWPVWIALLSMLLIYLGPLLTKAQLPQHAEPTHHSAEHKHHGHPPEHTPDKHSDPFEHLAHGDCGYCVLLTKLPAMSPQGAQGAPSDHTGSRHPASLTSISAPRGIPSFPNAPVRAPPLIV
ncbi:DUF2946 domain-containing protein [Marinobacter salarius]|uniref:DUF2946 domain-containing protein n=1 Tax=Marinobacter salarius TaxID=1420917 RepID=UPI003D14EA5A